MSISALPTLILRRLRKPIYLNNDDRRLIVAGAPVLALSALLFSALFADRIVTLSSSASVAALWEQQARRSRIYPVLAQQDRRPPAEREQIRALSDATAEGTGGITTAYGFHTLTDDDTFQRGAGNSLSGDRRGRVGRKGEAALSSAARGERGRLRERGGGDGGRGGSGRGGSASRSARIPSNYRFRQDFLLRYDGSNVLSIARQQIVGYDYFRQMLQRIRESFSPPGVNYIVRDRAGYVINQPIKPQVVEVLFALGADGQVTDVRKVYSIGQELVDQACINVLQGRNFGPPPAELLEQGNIFGIRFVFPDIRAP